MTPEALVIGLHLWSSHFGACHESVSGCVPYRSETVGVYAKAPSGLTMGAYRNSFGRPSAYVGYTFETEDRRFALLAAAVTGYAQSPVIPAAVPSVRLPVSSAVAFRLAYVPRVKHDGPAVLHASVEHRW